MHQIVSKRSGSLVVSHMEIADSYGRKGQDLSLRICTKLKKNGPIRRARQGKYWMKPIAVRLYGERIKLRWKRSALFTWQEGWTRYSASSFSPARLPGGSSCYMVTTEAQRSFLF